MRRVSFYSQCFIFSSSLPQDLPRAILTLGWKKEYFSGILSFAFKNPHLLENQEKLFFQHALRVCPSCRENINFKGSAWGNAMVLHHGAQTSSPWKQSEPDPRWPIPPLWTLIAPTTSFIHNTTINSFLMPISPTSPGTLPNLRWDTIYTLTCIMKHNTWHLLDRRQGLLNN